MSPRPLLALAALLAAGAARGAETASFLDLGVGARGLGMGGAYTALADDADALSWNPAGLAALEKREARASHAELGESVRHDALAYAHPAAFGTLAAGAVYLSHGDLDGRDALGRPTGGFDASDAAVSLGFARGLGAASAGAAVKYVRSHIAGAEAQSFAVDAGLRAALGPWRLGAALRNLGPGLRYGDEKNDLPLRLAFAAARVFEGGHALAAEFVNGPRGTGSDGAFGAEFQAVRNVFLRGGYATRSAIGGGTGFDAARGLTLGLGFRDARWELSYAALPMGELGSAHRFTLAARF